MKGLQSWRWREAVAHRREVNRYLYRDDNSIVIQTDIIPYCLGKGDTGSGPLYPIMGFGQIYLYQK